jgi:translation elongation factor EF-G
MIINIFIPILIIFAKNTNDNELQALCEQIYQEFNGLELNNIDELMKRYMTEEQYSLSQSKAIYQQGLLNIYHKYCINHLCKLCKANLEM